MIEAFGKLGRENEESKALGRDGEGKARRGREGGGRAYFFFLLPIQGFLLQMLLPAWSAEPGSDRDVF